MADRESAPASDEGPVGTLARLKVLWFQDFQEFTIVISFCPNKFDVVIIHYLLCCKQLKSK